MCIRDRIKDLPTNLVHASSDDSAVEKQNASSPPKALTSESLELKDLKRKDNDHAIHKIEFGLSQDHENGSMSPPNSISLDECYDLAYAHSRKKTDKNLLEIVEKEIILRSLKETGGNQVKAASILGITRATLRKRIDNYEIRY